jgi:hypothetical protein
MLNRDQVPYFNIADVELTPGAVFQHFALSGMLKNGTW